MASLVLSNDELKQNLAMVMGVSRDYANDWDAETISDVDRIIRSGRRRFFSAYDWSFLVKDFPIELEAPNEVDITVTAGVVSLDAGSWPTDPTAWLIVIDGVPYSIASFTTPLATLTDTSISTTADDVKMYKSRYDLDSNFAAFESPVVLQGGHVMTEMGTLPDYSVRSLSSKISPKTGEPRYFSIWQTVTNETGEPTYYMHVWPLPEQAYVVTTRIRIQPGDALEEVNSFHSLFAECMQTSVLAAAEQLYNDEPGVHTQRLSELLPEAINKDRRTRGVRNIVSHTQGRPLPWYADLAGSSVDLSGITIP